MIIRFIKKSVKIACKARQSKKPQVTAALKIWQRRSAICLRLFSDILISTLYFTSRKDVADPVSIDLISSPVSTFKTETVKPL